MSPEVFAKWEHIIDGVEKTKIPIKFIEKLILKLDGRKQKTINIKKLFSQGLEADEIEMAVVRKLDEYDEEMVGIEFVLDYQGIADIVQPEIDDLLKSVK